MKKNVMQFVAILTICTCLSSEFASHPVVGNTTEAITAQVSTSQEEVTNNFETNTVIETTTVEETTISNPTSPSKPSKRPIKISFNPLKIRLTKNKVTWLKTQKATGYEIWARKNRDPKFQRIAIIKKNNYLISKLKKGNFYRIKVRAFRKYKGRTYRSKFSKTVKFLTKTPINHVSSNIAGNLTVKWDESKVAGYILEYSTNPSFRDSTRKTYRKNYNTSAIFYEMKQNARYYVRVRSYRTVGKTKYYSPWSSTKSTVIKNTDDIINGGFVDTQGFFKDSVFFGDSVMLGFSNYVNRKPRGYLDGTRVFGIGSYSLIHAINPNSPIHPLFRGKHLAPEYLAKEIGAKKIFLFFGINDVCTGDGLEGAYSNYMNLIANIKRENPTSQIYIISATYTLKGSKLDYLFHERLHKLNDWMRSYCANSSCQFIDIASYLSDDEGYLKPEYCSDGFLHESYSAYEVWDKVLRNFALNNN